MCGVVGFLNQNSNRGDPAKILESMCQTLHHRGPNDQGQWFDQDAGIHLGHTRLSIIDLSPMGHQPMVSHSGRYVISYNGEIYNFAALKEELDQHPEGSRPPSEWKGHSDTEVILNCIEQWGLEKALERFVGMFAFALWDRQDRTLHLVRDRIGIKPLYYGWQNDTFIFGSELKPFKQHPSFIGEIDREALQLYMLYAFIPPPHSIYQNIFKLPPGHFISIKATSSKQAPVPVPYWSAEQTALQGLSNPFSGSDQEAIEELDQLLRDSIRLRMIADVPLGAFLSGGIDSSTVAAIMQAESTSPVKTFSIGFEEKDYNEAEYAKAVAQHLKTDHTELYVTPGQARDVIPKMPTLYDEPFSDSSQIPTFLVSELTQRYVKVSLSGDGGDEVFGGYNRYLMSPNLWRRMKLFPEAFRKAGSLICTTLSPSQWDALFRTLGPVLPAALKHSNIGDKIHKLAEVLPAQSRRELFFLMITHWNKNEKLVRDRAIPTDLNPGFPVASELENYSQDMMLLDLLGYLPGDILTKVDRASMGVSLEARIPLVDHRVVAFAWRLPLHMKIRNGKSKWLLRQVLGRYIPDSLIERPKMGFSIPLHQWLRGPLRDWAEDLLDPGRMRDEGYLNPEPVQKKWQEHLSGKYSWPHHLWAVLMFQSWLRHK